MMRPAAARRAAAAAQCSQSNGKGRCEKTARFVSGICLKNHLIMRVVAICLALATAASAFAPTAPLRHVRAARATPTMSVFDYSASQVHLLTPTADNARRRAGDEHPPPLPPSLAGGRVGAAVQVLGQEGAARGQRRVRVRSDGGELCRAHRALRQARLRRPVTHVLCFTCLSSGVRGVLSHQRMSRRGRSHQRMSRQRRDMR